MVGMDCPLKLASPSPINLTLTAYPLVAARIHRQLTVTLLQRRRLGDWT